jgi:surface rod structure-forming protein G/transglycosylase-like protein with SLT domain/uncharacterized protein DUF348
MASPCFRGIGGWGEKAIDRRRLLSGALHLGRLAIVTYLVAAGTWAVLAAAAPSGAVLVVARAAPAARGQARLSGATVTVSIDGLATSVVGATTVGSVLDKLGVAARGADRLSAAGDAAVVAGQRLALDRGVPVTLMDGGRVTAARSPRGTVADLLAAEQVTLGPLDVVDPGLDEVLEAGAVVRVTRVADREETVREATPFAVGYISDPNLDRGREVVVTAGQLGEVANTYHVRVVDGQEVERDLLASEEIAAPVEEVRHVGTRAPVVPADIEAIIRAAATRYGADPDQLLRVAWCESRYNPNAYNPSGASGLFQFMPTTWSVNSARAGYVGASPFDPVAAANVAAWMFAQGSANLWACR